MLCIDWNTRSSTQTTLFYFISYDFFGFILSLFIDKNHWKSHKIDELEWTVKIDESVCEGNRIEKKNDWTLYPMVLDLIQRRDFVYVF